MSTSNPSRDFVKSLRRLCGKTFRYQLFCFRAKVHPPTGKLVGSGKVTDDHPGVAEADQFVLETNSGVIEAHLRVIETRPGVLDGNQWVLDDPKSFIIKH
jgi:hypothetical protein